MRFAATPLLLVLGLFAAAFAAEPEKKPSAADLAFFEQKIRPVLVEHCYSCHSASSKRGPRGGLRVDTREALRHGGDSGPAVIPGKPTASWLLKALRGDEAPEMPPSGKLPDSVIADFERWIANGAPDPRDTDAKNVAAKPSGGIDLEAGRKFWAYQPPTPPSLPSVSNVDWVRTPIDQFILAKIEAAGARPNPDLSRAMLIRRLTVDLHGLLPTPEEVAEFVADPASDDQALARLVDRLLASPRYGERWGRHWLDVARYADSNGKDENLTFHEAYLYRDWVIRQFNEDKPYDQFIREQIAGDLLPAADVATRNDLLTATGFLVIGPKVLADRDQKKRKADVVDEQIDTIGRAFLGQTLGCARCHDHKFDPIPQADYYALAGIFNSTRTLDGYKLGNPIVSGWMLRPLDGPEGEKRLAARKKYEDQLKSLAAQIKKAKADLNTVETTASMRNVAALIGITVDDTQAKLVGTWKPSTFTKPYVGSGYIHDNKEGKGEKSATFTPTLPRTGDYEVLISYTPGNSRANNVPVKVRYAGGEKIIRVDQTKSPTIDQLFVSLGTFPFTAGTTGSVVITTNGTNGHVIVDSVRFIPKGELEKIPAEAMGITPEVRQQLAAAKEKLKQLEDQEAALKKSAPPPPRMVMAVRDDDEIADSPVHIRGNPHQLGPVIPRGVLQVASFGPKSVFPNHQSGRLELANWLADRRNPLTARVYVNRIWSHLFGEGIVRTVDLFTLQGERPNHPELLDYLAIQFMNEGWSTKRLIRHIVLSRVYRLTADSTPGLSKLDPENRLLARANRRRLEAEVIRDAILQVAGQLDSTGGGPVVAHLPERAITNESTGGINSDANRRRSVYLPIIRNDLPPIFDVFDFADPDTSTGKRNATTVPTQALFLLNNPFILAQAKATATRLLAEKPSDPERLTFLYRLAYSRSPTSMEIASACDFLRDYQERLASLGSAQATKDPRLAAWTALAQAIFCSTEFRFLE